MAVRDEPKTCEELADDEYCEQHECYAQYCKQPNVQQLMDQFWPNSDGRALEAADLLFIQKLCPDFLTNGAETACGCVDGEVGPCDSCGEVRTGCDDPEQCPNRNYGIDLVVVLKAALHAMSLAHIPVAGMEYPTRENPSWPMTAGQVLVWDPQAIPQNKNWDDCKPSLAGAYVATDLKTIVAECLAEIGEG